MKKKGGILSIVTALILSMIFVFSCTDNSGFVLPTPDEATVAGVKESMNNVLIYLTWRNEELQWSVDNESWNTVGPESPSTTINYSTNIVWEVDDTIDEVLISFENDDLMSLEDTKSKKSKKAKTKNEVLSGMSVKYDIIVTVAKTKEVVIVDPEIKICDPTCPPGGD